MPLSQVVETVRVRACAPRALEKGPLRKQTFQHGYGIGAAVVEQIVLAAEAGVSGFKGPGFVLAASALGSLPSQRVR